MSFYSVARVVVSPFFRWFLRVTTKGVENIPKTGPVILCSNHKSMSDPFLLGIVLNRPLYFMAKAELFKIPLFNLLIISLGAFPVHRGRGDMEAIKKSLAIIKKGRVLAMFPEGTRLKEGETPAMFKLGAAKFAYKTKATVLPVSIVCRGKIKPFKKKIIEIGKPMGIEELGLTDGSMENLKGASERIRKKVTEMIESNIDCL